jgi:hypothetical protein
MPPAAYCSNPAATTLLCSIDSLTETLGDAAASSVLRLCTTAVVFKCVCHVQHVVKQSYLRLLNYAIMIIMEYYLRCRVVLAPGEELSPRSFPSCRCCRCALCTYTGSTSLASGTSSGGGLLRLLPVAVAVGTAVATGIAAGAAGAQLMFKLLKLVLSSALSLLPRESLLALREAVVRCCCCCCCCCPDLRTCNKAVQR